jgi:hypothetical protein
LFEWCFGQDRDSAIELAESFKTVTKAHALAQELDDLVLPIK